MQRSPVTLKVLSPRGKVTGMTEVSLSPRLGDLNGKRIGVLNNTKSGGEMLLPYIMEALKRRFPTVQSRTWRIPVGLPPDHKEPKLREIAEYSDGVITLMGD